MDCSQVDGQKQQSEEELKEILEAVVAAAAEANEEDTQGWNLAQDDAVDIDYTQKGKSSGKGNRYQGGKGPMGPMQMILQGIRGMKGGGKSSGKGKQFGNGKGSGKGNPECYKCGKQGHIAKYCPNSPGGPDTRKCRRCGKIGHIERNCRSAMPAREIK